jgi:hypothetical protein
VNLVEPPTSSNATPTEHSSAETAEVKTKEINGLIVDADSHIDWAIGVPTVLPVMALKCSSCKIVTIYEGFEIGVANLTDRTEKVKRFLVCSNCGATSTK